PASRLPGRKGRRDAGPTTGQHPPDRVLESAAGRSRRRRLHSLEAFGTIPGGWPLHGLGAALPAPGAQVALAFHGGFRTYLFARPEDVLRHRRPLLVIGSEADILESPLSMGAVLAR